MKEISDDDVMTNGIILDSKSINNEIYALIKYKIGSYSIVHNPVIENGKLVNFKFIQYFQNFLLAKYNYGRMIDRAQNKPRKKAVMER